MIYISPVSLKGFINFSYSIVYFCLSLKHLPAYRQLNASTVISSNLPGVRGSSTGRESVSKAIVTSITSEWNLWIGFKFIDFWDYIASSHIITTTITNINYINNNSTYCTKIWYLKVLLFCLTNRINIEYPLRTAVASATVAGMIKKELADTASWNRLM